MRKEEVIEKVNKVFEESFEVEPEKLLPDQLIFEDLGLDSLDLVDLIVALQGAFGVSLRSQEGLGEIRTLGDLHNFILTLMTEGATQPPKEEN